jgi:hypothetical protein
MVRGGIGLDPPGAEIGYWGRGYFGVRDLPPSPLRKQQSTELPSDESTSGQVEG